MKKILISIITIFILNSCGIPFKIEIRNSSFGRNADGSIFFGYKSKAPAVLNDK